MPCCCAVNNTAPASVMPASLFPVIVWKYPTTASLIFSLVPVVCVKKLLKKSVVLFTDAGG
jgi:hypothetical protein